jgi:hypothetical protein
MTRFTVKATLLFLLAAAVLTSCATRSTIESRKAERAAAYSALAPETRELVDRGQIKVGMSMDAVYIAWGSPAEILQSETEAGAAMIWLYHGGWMQETRYWSYRQIGSGDHAYLERYLDRDYQPRTYIRAEIVFVNGAVRQWRTLPQPPY